MASHHPSSSSSSSSSSTLLHLLLLIISILPSSSSSSPSPSPSIPPEALPTNSGYLPVNSSSNSSIFFLFYESQTPSSSSSSTPLLIWLQGGPGCSSMVGNFFELGPWRIDPKTHRLNPNSAAWNRLFGLLFLDNPIGTGFSIAGNPSEIPRDQIGVAKHLFIAIQNFLRLYPLFKSRPIYITGESYAGKYVPAIGYYILKMNPRFPPEERINLAGVAIGNGLTDPITQVGTHAINAYFSGLINEKQKTQLEEAQNIAINLAKAQKWSEATDARTSVLHLLQNMTGLATLYDMRRKIPYETYLVEKFLSSTDVKKALGVRDVSVVWEECSDIVGKVLHEDVMKSVKYMVEFLVKETRVLLYQGQSDLRDGVVSTEAWIRVLEWDLIEEFMSAERRVWRVGDEVAGYVQKWGGLSHVVVLGAGHFVPFDQGLHSQVMIQDWVLERGVFGGGGRSHDGGLGGHRRSSI